MNFIAFWEIWKNIYIFKIPFYVILAEKSLKTEDQARNWRQENFKHFNQIYSFQKVSLGHTATDRIETSLANLGRGTSPQAIYTLKQKIIFKTRYSNLEFLNKEEYFFKICDKCFSSKQTEKKKNISKIIPFDSSFSYYMIKTSCSLIARKRILNTTRAQWDGKRRILKTNLKTNTARFQLENFNRLNSKSILVDMIVSFYKLEKNLTPNLEFIRPLERYYRGEITRNIKENKFSIIFDPTNQNTKLGRNKIRKTILPVLQTNINKNFEQNFNHFLVINDFEQNFLKNLQTKILKNDAIKEQFQKLPNNLQKQIIHRIFEKYTDRQISYIQIQVLIQKFKKHKWS